MTNRSDDAMGAASSEEGLLSRGLVWLELSRRLSILEDRRLVCVGRH